MSKAAVVYWSSAGNPDAVAAGAKAAGADVTEAYVSDFDAASIGDYDAIALGCPAMGDEELEDSEFRPFFDEIKGALSGKKLVLFGSYDWGDGDWMRSWETECKEAGADLAADGLICNLEPDDDAKAECEALGKLLA